MSVFGWSADNSGCEWYRLALPLDAMARRGHETAYSRLLTPLRPDVLIGQRVANPGPSAIWQALAGQYGPLLDRRRAGEGDAPGWVYDVAAGRAAKPVLVYELDDDLLNIDATNRKAFQFFNDPVIRNSVIRNVELADIVTVSTGQLASLVRTYNPNVKIVPNYLPDWLPGMGAESIGDDEAHGDHSPMVIGWAGSSSHTADVAEAQQQVGRFLKRTPGAELHTIGMPWGGCPQRVSPWAPNVRDFYGLLDFDIGLAPLRPSVFNRSKSPVKVMEYAALGIATVASNVGPYADYIEHGRTGLLVDRPHEWTTALRSLVHDRELRAELVRNAWGRACDLTIGRNVQTWERAILT